MHTSLCVSKLASQCAAFLLKKQDDDIRLGHESGGYTCRNRSSSRLWKRDTTLTLLAALLLEYAHSKSLFMLHLEKQSEK